MGSRGSIGQLPNADMHVDATRKSRDGKRVRGGGLSKRSVSSGASEASVVLLNFLTSLDAPAVQHAFHQFGAGKGSSFPLPKRNFSGLFTTASSTGAMSNSNLSPGKRAMLESMHCSHMSIL